MLLFRPIVACLLVAGIAAAANVEFNIPDAIQRRQSPSCVKIKPSPAARTCGVAGFITRMKVRYYGRVNVTQTATSFDDCANICLTRQAGHLKDPISSCLAFGYDASTSLCTFFRDRLAGQAFRADARSPVVWSDAGCYSCARQCPSAVGVNLLSNGGFEASNKYIGPFSLDLDSDPSAGGPNASYFITSPGDRSNRALATRDAGALELLQAFYFCAGQLYSMTYSIKIADVGKPAYEQTVDAGASTSVLYGYPDGASGSWATRTIYFFGNSYYGTTATGLRPVLNELSLRLVASDGTLPFNIDNIAIVPTTAKTALNMPSVIANGGFETRSLAHWNGTQSKFASVASPGISSQYGYIVQQDNKGFDTHGSLKQDIKVIAGATYIFGFSYVSNGKNPFGNLIDINLIASNTTTGKKRTHYSTYIYPVPGRVADNYTLPFVAETSLVSIHLDITVSASKASFGSNFTVDNIFFTKMASS